MFTFRVSEYSNALAANPEATITSVETTGTYFGIPYSLQPTTETIAAIVPVNTTGTVTAVLPPNLDIVVVYYAGETFRADQFVYSETTGLLTLTSSFTGGGETLTYLTADPNVICTTFTTEAISQFLLQWNVEGEIFILRRFEDHPTLSLEFVIDCDQKDLIETVFCPGLEKLILGYWRLSRVTTEEDNSNKIRVFVEATGVWAPYNRPSRSRLDLPIGIKDGDKKFRTVGEFAGVVNVSYSGPNITYRVPRNLSSQEFTTLRRTIEERAIIYNGFVFYDDPQQVRVKTFGSQTTHTVSNAALFDLPDNKIETVYSGAGPLVSGVKLSDELRAALLLLQFETEQFVGQTCRYEFINAKNVFECTLAAESQGIFDGPFEILVQPSIETLRTGARNYDAGGYFKQWVKITELDGVPLQIERHVYGYRYSSADTYEIAGTEFQFITFKSAITEQPQQYWGELLVSNTYFVYDDEGYLIRAYTIGQESARLRQETEDNEAVRLLAQALQLGLNLLDPPSSPPEAQALYNQSLAYAWTELLPIDDQTDYTLRLFRDFYPDIEIPVNDDDFVDPKFFARKIRFRKDFFLADNPDTNEVGGVDVPLPPIVVENFLQEEERQRVTSVNTPERYNRTESILNQQGPGGINAIRQNTLDQIIGRPPIHTRLEVGGQINDNNSLQNYLLYKDKRYLLFTPDAETAFDGTQVNELDFTETRLSYPDVDDPNLAREIAEYEYTILNTRNAQQLTIGILWRPNVKVGDTVLFRGRKYIIFEIAEIREVDYRQLKAYLILSMGRFVNVPVTLEEVKVNIAIF